MDLVTPAHVVTPLVHPRVQGVDVCVLTPVGFVIAHVEVTALMQCKNCLLFCELTKV